MTCEPDEGRLDYLNEKHVVFGQVLDEETAKILDDLKKFVIVENCWRISENSEVKIVDAKYEEVY